MLSSFPNLHVKFFLIHNLFNLKNVYILLYKCCNSSYGEENGIQMRLLTHFIGKFHLPCKNKTTFGYEMHFFFNFKNIIKLFFFLFFFTSLSLYIFCQNLKTSLEINCIEYLNWSFYCNNSIS